MRPCKHLDYSREYTDCELIEWRWNCSPYRFWRRGPSWCDYPGAPRDVQFCCRSMEAGGSRGRVNNPSLCYTGEGMCSSCYEPVPESNSRDAAEDGVVTPTADELRELLEDVAYQFGYRQKRNGREYLTAGCLSTLEDVFEALGWSDPHLIPQRRQMPSCEAEEVTRDAE